MHLLHVAIRAQDPEPLKAFHCPLFGGQTNGCDHKPSRSVPAWYASRAPAWSRCTAPAAGGAAEIRVTAWPDRRSPDQLPGSGIYTHEAVDGYKGLLLSESPRNMAGRLRQPGKAVNPPG